MLKYGMYRITLLAFLALNSVGLSQDKTNPKLENEKSEQHRSVAELVRESRDSIVVVTTEGRDGGESGMGTGFVIDQDGLIATNMHVIGEARPISIRTRDGKQFAVTEIFASDRSLDLAIVRIDTKEKLIPLPLANEEFSAGDPAVAIGHPLGLKNSVVNGIVAAERDVNGTPMWQVAMAIEPGNSGGPLLDMHGKVQGIVTMKSTGTEAFGFAVKIAELKKLIERPNPIAIKQWQTIGQLDPRRWTPTPSARWRQRGGRLTVTDPGTGFGGRSILLRADNPPTTPFELAVSVKMDDESGAAGLVFHSDGGDKHYGFYPSNGRLRLTSFQGPTVFTWNVIREVESGHYQPGEWNEIKVRVEDKRVIGYVNGHEVTTINELRHVSGQIGLCKFRDTKAEFKNFRFGKQVSTVAPTAEQLKQLTDELTALPPRSDLSDAQLASGSTDPLQRMAVLERQATALESQAAELRMLGKDIHVFAVCEQLRSITSAKKDADIDLLSGALWIAKLDNPELDVDTYVDVVDSMATAIHSQFRDSMSDTEKLATMDTFLFTQNAFHGSRTNYYDEANSHMDRVIDDREGLPVTLSVLYMALAKRLGLNVVGVGLPGHFVVRHEPTSGDPQLIDVFDRGARMSRDEARLMVTRFTGRPPLPVDFVSAKHKDILFRMLTNLHGIAQSNRDPAAMLRYTEAIVAINPESTQWRGIRAVLRHQNGRKSAALDDLDWILKQQPEKVDLEQVRRMREAFSR